MRKCFLLVIVLALFLHHDVPPVLACSGGLPTTVAKLIDNAEVVVHGRLALVDDAEQNGILQVKSYLTGEPGPEYIFLSLYEPAQVRGFQERFSGGGCYYGVSPGLPVGEDIIIFLQRNTNGSYSLAPRHHSNPDYYYFSEDSPTSVVFLVSEYDEASPNGYHYETKTVNQADFIDLIAELSGEQPQPPLDSSPYPLFAPLLLTTASGTHYLLPVDGAEPVALTPENIRTLRRDNPGCSAIGCVGFSPNGVDRAHLDWQDGEGLITLTYGDTITGDAFLFSPTSDALAVWVTQHGSSQIQIYTLRYSRLRIQDHEAIPWRSIDLNRRGEWMSATGQAAWSPDGRQLAFSDARGLWLWDVFTADSTPELLSDNNQIFVEGWSATGRYLTMLEHNETMTILDLVTGEYLPGGALSPDDRVLITYENPSRLIYLTPFNPGSIPLLGEVQVKRAIWQNNNTYTLLTCPEEANRAACEVHERTVTGLYSSQHTGYDFDYEPDSNSLVILQDDYKLVTYTRTSRGQYRYEHDLSEWLDSPIFQVEWLPSLLYND